MRKIQDYITNIKKQSSLSKQVFDKLGDLSIGQLSLASLLTIHALISETNDGSDLETSKLLDIIHLHIIERLEFVPENESFGQYLLNQEKSVLSLKHVYYAQKILLHDFETKLQLEGQEKLNLIYRLIYDRFVELFVLLSNIGVKNGNELTNQFFSIKDLDDSLNDQFSSFDKKSAYCNQLQERIVLELEELKFLKNLSDQGILHGIRSILHLIKVKKEPFLIADTEVVCH